MVNRVHLLSKTGLNWIYLFILTVTTVCNGQTTEECISKINSCSCKTKNGKIDLDPLDGVKYGGGSPKFTGIQDSNQDTYSYNPCSSYSESSCTNVASCQTSGIYTNPIATQDTAEFIKDPTLGTVLKYTGTDRFDYPTTVNVQLVCDKNQEGSLTVATTATYGIFTYTLTTKHACASNGNSSKPTNSTLSAGDVLLIIFFSTVVVYLVSGLLINKFYNDYRGKELMPQREFWMSLPGLVVDGGKFCWEKASNAYSSCRAKGTDYEDLDAVKSKY